MSDENLIAYYMCIPDIRDLPQFRDMYLCSCPQYAEINALVRDFAIHTWNKEHELDEMDDSTEETTRNAQQEDSLFESPEVLNSSDEQNGDLQKFRALHSQGSLYKDELAETRISKDDSGNLVFDLHSRVLLSWWNEAMNSGGEKSDAGSFLSQIPTKIQNFYVDENYKGSKEISSQDTARLERVMVLLNILTRDLMKLGTATRYTNYRAEDILCMMLSEKAGPGVLPLFNQFAKYFLTLIAHDHRHTSFKLLRIGLHDNLRMPEGARQAGQARDLAQVLVSILPHDQFEAYRLKVKRAGNEWDLDALCGRCGTCVVCIGEAQRRREAPEEFEPLPDVPAPRSLENLCRLKLYDIIPGHLLPKFIEASALPKLLKVKLTLGIEDLLAWNVKKLM